MEKKEHSVLFYIGILAVCIITIGFVLLSPSSDDKKSTSNKKNVESAQVKKVDKLNDWFKNKYSDEQTKAWSKDGIDYFGSEDYRKMAVISKFKYENDNLIVMISNNQLEAEGFEQKEIANYALNVVINDYSGDLNGFDNIKDNRLKDEYHNRPQQFSELD